ncbi:MAG: protein kinase, partial [Gemmatimonas sp.]
MPPDNERSALPELSPDSVFGPYRIVRLLGRGGMGAVYEAEHRADGRVVALKLLSVDLDKMDARARFLREGLTAAAINHPNTVYIYGTEEIDGTPAISMELVSGGTLDEKVKSRGPLPWAEAVDDILQVIDGLDAALAAGVLHRDVKPSNCFVGADGTVKIGDFGLSKPVEHDEQLKLTQTGVFLGTPVFSSPEQLLGESLDVRSDIYAVGVTFYSLLTGSLPYHSGSMMQVVAAVLNGSPTPLAQHRSDLPAGVIAVVQKAMARKLEDRYQTYAEFRSDVAALRAVDVAPATLWDRFRAWVVDGTVNFLLVSLAVGMAQSTDAKSVDWRRVLVSLVIALLVVGTPEGLRGASIGKWLVGIRVVGPHGGVPGLARAAARVTLLSLTDFATAGVQAGLAGSSRLAAIILVSSLIFHGVFLLTARRRNGWRLLHDVITGTRVVRPLASSAHRRSETRAVVVPRMTGDEPRLGPYVVLGKAQDDGGILHG